MSAQTTDELPSLDVRHLWREHGNDWKPGTKVTGVLTDASTFSAFLPSASDPDHPERAAVIFEGSGRGVWLLFDWTPMGGGYRIWAKCGCGQRVAVVYRQGQSLRCRTCLGLRYRSQRTQNPRSREGLMSEPTSTQDDADKLRPIRAGRIEGLRNQEAQGFIK